jgi:hypothetical protein
MTAPPSDRALGTATAFAPAAVRTLTVFGAPAELVLLPERAQRSGVPGPDRPAFRSSPAGRILRDETRWREDGLAVTPNRFPFARDQWLLWDERDTREHGIALLHMLFAWVGQRQGTGFVNSIGAAASIPRAHAHVTGEQLPFLAGLPESPCTADFLPPTTGVHWTRKQLPFWLLGARGSPESRAAAIFALQQARATAAFNLVVQDGTTWLYPRSVEIPAPHFPWALGAAEVWGRWCYVQREPFERATGSDLEQALASAGMPWR